MNFSKIHSIKINGEIISSDKVQQADIEDELVPFLTEWFNSNDYITVQSSGSTGKPKNIQLKKQYVLASAKSTCEYLNIHEQTQVLLCLPVKYIGGKMMVVRAILSGCNLITTSATKNPLSEINQDIDFAAMTPYQFEHTLDQDPIKTVQIGTIILGGAPVSKRIKERIKALPHTIYETFGMTETISHIALKNIKQSDSFTVLSPTLIGKNENNQLIIHAPQLGVNQLTTNDCVELTSPNTFKWLGRHDFVINSGGIKIQPEELEQEISNITGITLSDLMITFLEDNILGQRVVLCSTKRIILSKLQKLPKYHIPKEVFLLPTFEYTANGKLNRKATREKLLNQINNKND